MQASYFSSAGLPEHHPSTLVVKFRPTASFQDTVQPGFERLVAARVGGDRTLLGNDASEALSSFAFDLETVSPGMAALEAYNRSGKIRSITSLARTGDGREIDYASAYPGMATASFMSHTVSARTNEAARAIESGVQFVELDEGSKVDALQRELSRDPSIENVSLLPVRYLNAARRATRTAPPNIDHAMWNLRKIRWQEARGLRKFVEPESINVAVLDTGLDEQHPELRDHVARYEWLPEVGSVSSPEDIVGHGTHVAGTIVADFNNTVGIHGICQCRLNAWKIFGDTANYYRSIGYYTYVVDPVMYLRALLDCLDADMDVINLSIGGPGKPSPQEQFAFDALLANGTAIVAAMGNERASGSPTSYPAAIPGVIAVTATRPNDTIANFSSRGKHATIAAPGVSIWSTLPSYPGNSGYEANRSSGTVRQGKPLYREKDYDAWSGTSMASPHVAAATAVLLSSKGSMPVSSVEQALRDSAVKVADMRGQDFDHDFGSGRLDLESLLS